MSLSSSRIYPVPVKPASDIATWRGWPDDVRDTLLAWNRRRGLTFLRLVGTFKCQDCTAFCEPHTNGAAVFHHNDRRRLWDFVCDDCLIARARDGWEPPVRHEGHESFSIPRGADQ